MGYSKLTATPKVRGREWFPSWSLRRAELCHFDFGHGTPEHHCSGAQVSGTPMSLGRASGVLHSQCLLFPQLLLQVITGQKEQTAVGSYVDRLGVGVTREAGKGRGKVIGLLGTLGRLLLDCGVYSLPRGHAARCEGALHTTHRGGEYLNRESSTHRLGAVSAAVPRLILGQPLFLLVQRPRLQDHLFQLKGGITVQAAFLWRDRLLSPACRSPTYHPDSLESPVWAHWAYIGHKAWLHLLFTQVVPQHMGQRWGCLHVLETGEPVLRVHGEELQGGPLSDKAPQKNGYLSQVEATLEGVHRMRLGTSGSKVACEERWHQGIWP